MINRIVVLILLFSCFNIKADASLRPIQLDRIKITVYVYHLKPPYITNLEEQKGLYFDLVSLFNESQSEFKFDVQFMPRSRINREIAQNTLSSLVLGVHPVWFADKSKTKFMWSGPILYDQDEFVSPKSKPFEYKETSSLHNQLIGGVMGYHYFRVAPVAKSGLARMVYSNSEQQLLEMIVKERIDLGVISRATINYYLALNPSWGDNLHFSDVAHEQYYRAIMAPKSLAKPISKLSELLVEPNFAKKLNTLLISYNFDLTIAPQ